MRYGCSSKHIFKQLASAIISPYICKLRSVPKSNFSSFDILLLWHFFWTEITVNHHNKNIIHSHRQKQKAKNDSFWCTRHKSDDWHYADVEYTIYLNKKGQAELIFRQKHRFFTQILFQLYTKRIHPNYLQWFWNAIHPLY